MLKTQMEKEIKRQQMELKDVRIMLLSLHPCCADINKEITKKIIEFLPRITVSLEKIAECLHRDSKHIHTNNDAIDYVTELYDE